MNSTYKPKAYSYTVRPFMRELGLSGNSLIVFASLYSFTQGEHKLYWGSQARLAASLGISLRNTQYCIKKLKEKGLIEKKTSADGKLGYATTVVDESAPKEYVPPTEKQLENRKYKIISMGADKRVKMTFEQVDRLRLLIEEDVIVQYVWRLDALISEALLKNKPVPTSHYRIIRKWIEEDFAADSEEDIREKEKEETNA